MTTAQYVISKAEGLKSLKKAKSVVFHLRNGQSFINCIMDDNNREMDVQIDCGTEASGGHYPGEYDLGAILGASHVLMHPQYDEEWQTVLSMIKDGDELTLKWRACNNSQYLTRAGLYKDELFLVIRRYNGSVMKKKLSFMLAASICENNTAKMIKHTSTPKSILGGY